MSGMCMVRGKGGGGHRGGGQLTLGTAAWCSPLSVQVQLDMMSVKYPLVQQDDVLDLSVRPDGASSSPYPAEYPRRRSSSPSNDSNYSNSDAAEYKVAFPGDYTATVAVLQQRFYEDRMRSPPTSPDAVSNSAQDAFVPQQAPHPQHLDQMHLGQYPHLQPNGVLPLDAASNSIGKVKKARPFKAYQNNTLGIVTPVEGVVPDVGDDYVMFRQRMLDQVHATMGHNSTNKNMRRPSQSYSPPTSSGETKKDSSYWERRRKNNAAAKRSRDARRAKEDELAIRTAFLEQQNLKLRFELSALKEDYNRLRGMIYTGH